MHRSSTSPAAPAPSPSSFTVLLQNTPRAVPLLAAAVAAAAFTPLVASAPLLSHLPNDAARDMQSLINYLPPSVQHVISSSDGFTPAFLQSLMLILACELGDRTFFVAAILAMKSSRLVVWCGALLALALMTILSAAIGKAFPLLLDKKYTSIAAAALFLYFGLQLLRDYWRMRNENRTGDNEELVEVEQELKDSSSSAAPASDGASIPDVEQDNDDKKKKPPLFRPRSLTVIGTLVSPVFAKAFSMTALAEWGDRSQIATIALAASRDMTGVIVGGILGHSICTGLAVIGGRLLATSISEKAVTLMGGLLFVAFAFLTASGGME